MPYDDPDPQDPNVLVGVSVPAPGGVAHAMREMAYTFAEEFAALGYDEQRLSSLFQRPFYAGAHQAFQVLGEAEIRKIIQESLSAWGGYRIVVRDAKDDNSDLIQIEGDSCPK